MKIARLSQADSSYIHDKYLNNTMGTNAGLIQAEAAVIQLDEGLSDVHCIRLALSDYLSQCLGCWQHVT